LATEAYRHPGQVRRDILTAENQAFASDSEKAPRIVRYERDPDLDPQLVWRGKDGQDSGPFEVPAPPVYIQEKIQPKAIIEALKRHGRGTAAPQTDLFGDFGPAAAGEERTGAYEHANWSNRIILGDSLLAMASLAEREVLRGQVQMIYLDPPYGIRFSSNWQPTTKSKDVKDNNLDGVSREPEVIRAFRDTWSHGIHSYLTYLRDRLTVARDLLHERGSIFVQISDENLHLVTSLLAEVFGAGNQVAIIPFRKKTMPFGTNFIEQMSDFVVWFAKQKTDSAGRPFAKYRKLYREMNYGPESGFPLVRTLDGEVVPVSRLGPGWREKGQLATSKSMEPSGPMASGLYRPVYRGVEYNHPKNGYGCDPDGMRRLQRAGRVLPAGRLLRYLLLADDKAFGDLTAPWQDTTGADDKVYVVQTNTEVVRRCMLMSTDPGDLVLDPTCGSGVTAYVAEQWGRRWITIDTSRVAVALTRTRLMSARYDWFLLRDSEEGARQEAQLTGQVPGSGPFGADLRQGFVTERMPHVTLKAIAGNLEIDLIWERFEAEAADRLSRLNALLGADWQEWEVPEQPGPDWGGPARDAHAAWRELRRRRQSEMDASIARGAESQPLYDRPYKARGVVRVAGPFTVESLSPHRVLPLEEDPAPPEDEAGGTDPSAAPDRARAGSPRRSGQELTDFAQVVLEQLKAAGVQNTRKGEAIRFEWLKPFASNRGFVAFEGVYLENGRERRAAVAIGPEYDTVGYDFVRGAAREAATLFDTLIVCGFAFAPEVDETRLSLGNLTVLKARMNQDLRMADKLKATGAGNLFVVFGEPDIALEEAGDGMIRVAIKGVDIFDPTTGDVKSSDDPSEDIACWFIDDDYDEESFFVRQAYFLGRDPYESLKRALKAEIDEAAWAQLNSTVSRAFQKPKSGRVCVKVINHFGDEVQKVFDV
jgi:adenine-specific DNA-methyltransferase